jgi:hypothetical protein
VKRVEAITPRLGLNVEEAPFITNLISADTFRDFSQVLNYSERFCDGTFPARASFDAFLKSKKVATLS